MKKLYARDRNPDVTPKMQGLPSYRSRPPGQKQLSIDDMLKARQPTEYNDSVGKKAFELAIRSSLHNVDKQHKQSSSSESSRKRPRKRDRRDGVDVELRLSTSTVPLILDCHIKRTLTPEQRTAIDLVKQGQSFVLLGKAGTGKTYTLAEAIITGLENAGVEVMKCASTGRAATALRGMTVHQAVGLGLLDKLTVERVKRDTLRRKWLWQRWKDARVLVIDEFTMLSADDICKVEAAARVARGGMACATPFGGLVVIMCGDPCQLQCISDQQTGEPPLFMNSILPTMIPHIVYLRKIFRQKNLAYCHVLEDVRRGLVTPRVRSVLEARTRADLDPEHLPVSIFARREDVATSNEQSLQDLDGVHKDLQARVYVQMERYRIRGARTSPESEGSDADDDRFAERLVLQSVDIVRPGEQYDIVLKPRSGSAHDDDNVSDLPEHVRQCDYSLVDRRDTDAIKLMDKMFNDSNIMSSVKLKVGSKVMLTRNFGKMIEWGFVNGVTGKVVGFAPSCEDAGCGEECAVPDFVEDQLSEWKERIQEEEQARRSSKRSKKNQKTFGVSDVRRPDRSHPMHRHDGMYNLTEGVPGLAACILGEHPWVPGTKYYTYSSVPSVDDKWPVVQFVGVGRFICRSMKYCSPLRRLSSTTRASIVVEQVPLILCSAMTVHKVQGMTLSSAIVHLDSRMSQENQAYVALSRVQDEKGLYMSALCLPAIRANPAAVKFMAAVEAECDAGGLARTRDVLKLCVEQGNDRT